jgi:hypothetical protein
VKLSFLSLLLILAIGCSPEEGVTVTESIQQVKNKHENQLMTMPGVVSVGIGQGDNGQSVIVIGVESQAKLDKLTLPVKLDGYPVNVQIMGTIRAQ